MPDRSATSPAAPASAKWIPTPEEFEAISALAAVMAAKPWMYEGIRSGLTEAYTTMQDMRSAGFTIVALPEGNAV